MENQTNIAEYVAELDAQRAAMGMSYQDVADACDVSRATVYRALTGKTEPTMSLLQNIASAVQFCPAREDILPDELTQEAYITYLKQLVRQKDEAIELRAKQLCDIMVGEVKMECIKCKKSIPEDALFCPYCGKKQVREKRKIVRSRPNGTETVYKRGKTWQAEFNHGYVTKDGKKKVVRSTKGGFKTKKEALEYLPLLQNAPARKVPNLTELFEIYKQSKKYLSLSDSRKEKYNIAWKKSKASGSGKLICLPHSTCRTV